MWRLFRKPPSLPTTLPQAVALLKSRLSPAAAQTYRLGPWDFDAVPLPAGILFRELGLDDESGRALLRACDASTEEEAAVKILRALREELLRTATPAEIAADDAERGRREAETDERAAKEAPLTRGRCPWCNRPCPTYRVTCAYCGRCVRDRGERRGVT